MALPGALGSARGPDVSAPSLSHCHSQAEQTSLNGAAPTAPARPRSRDSCLLLPMFDVGLLFSPGSSWRRPLFDQDQHCLELSCQTVEIMAEMKCCSLVYSLRTELQRRSALLFQHGLGSQQWDMKASSPGTVLPPREQQEATKPRSKQ